MKKFIVLLLAASIALMAVSSAFASDIVFAGWSGEEASTKPTIEKMISDYNASGTGNTVTWVGWPWGDVEQQLVIRLQGGEALDIAQLDSGKFATIFGLDNCYEVQDLFDEEYISTLSEAGLDFGKNAEGKNIGVPWTMASIGMVYNPDILAKVGYSEPPATIDEFMECCAAIKAYDPDLIPYGLSTKDATATADFQPWLWAFGGELMDENDMPTVNSEAAVKTLTWYKEMSEKGYITANMSRFDARQLFAQGKIAFYDDAIGCRGIAITNGVPEDTVDNFIKPMLRPVVNEGDTPTSMMWGHILVVFKTSSDPAAAADFIKSVLSDEESLMYFENAGALPVTKSGLANEKVLNDPWASKWAAITETGATNELMLNPYSTELNNIISEEVQAVIVGQKSPEQAAEDMQNRMVSAMDE